MHILIYCIQWKKSVPMRNIIIENGKLKPIQNDKA